METLNVAEVKGLSHRETDVLVVGGGLAGIASAVAAARNGARTLLVERYGFLGGTATFGVPFLGVFNGRGDKAVGGILDEIAGRMVALGGSPGHGRGGQWRPELAGGDYEFSLTPFNPEILKFVLQEMALEAGAQLLLHTALDDVQVEDAAIRSVRLRGKGGSQAATASVFVDATGDGDLATAAEAPFAFGDDQGRPQNVTLLFNLADVDVERAVEALRNGVGLQGWGDWHIRLVRKPDVDGEETYLHFAGRAVLPDLDGRDSKRMTFTAVSFRRGQLFMNITRTTNVDATNSEALTRAEVEERRNLVKTWQALRKHVPGFERCYISHAAPQVGIRESRRILGDYVLTGEDVVSARQFWDQIALGSYPIDIHDPRGGATRFVFVAGGGSYGIPYRCLLPRGITNLLVAGRCISTTHEAAGSTRLMPTVVAIGQAAGTAAAVSSRQGLVPREASFEEIRSRLLAQGAILALA